MGRIWINSAASGDALRGDVKELIPVPELRRRMSRVLRMGVAAGMEALGGRSVDAIITATELGCLADSEKFLRNVIEQGETLLNPTPFIQSTFNTVGGQIALLTGCKGYNMTYVHGREGFGCALVDAAMLFEEGAAGSVLVGGFDEATPVRDVVLRRLGAKGADDGAWFFVLSAQAGEGCLGELSRFDWGAKELWEAVCGG